MIPGAAVSRTFSLLRFRLRYLQVPVDFFFLPFGFRGYCIVVGISESKKKRLSLSKFDVLQSAVIMDVREWRVNESVLGLYKTLSRRLIDRMQGRVPFNSATVTCSEQVTVSRIQSSAISGESKMQKVKEERPT